jgi:hypothetical protein
VDKTGDTDPSGVLSLLVEADEHGCEVVRHGAHVGLRGPRLSVVPQRLWAQLDDHEPQLLRLLHPEETPFRHWQKQRRAG